MVLLHTVLYGDVRVRGVGGARCPSHCETLVRDSLGDPASAEVLPRAADHRVMLRFHPLFCRLAPALAVAATLAVTAQARATTFGADLSLPANGTRTCSQGFYPDPLMAALDGC